VAGSLQSELGCSGDWDPGCSATHLVSDANDNVWQNTFSVPAGNWEYKAALNDSWDENYGDGAVRNGANISISLGALTNVKFYYDHETHWITDNVNSIIATAPGSYQSEIGCSGDWDPTCLRSWLQDPDGDGIYTFRTKRIPPGNYEVKIAINESWDENYGAGGVQNGPNISFTVSPSTSETLFSYNSTTHVLSVSTIEAPYTPMLEQLSPNRTEYPANNSSGFFTMAYSWYGDVQANIQPAANLGCDAADFTGFVPGNIALIKRGICTFFVKASNAQAAGASGVIVFNDGAPGRTDANQGTLGGPGITIPVVGTSFAIGNELSYLAQWLAQSEGFVVVHMVVDTSLWAVDKSAAQSVLTLSTGQQFLLNYSVKADVTSTGTIDECIEVNDSYSGYLGKVCVSEAPGTFTYSRWIGPYDVCGDYTVENTASFVANDTGTTGSDSQTVTVHVPCGGCTLSQGYWKTHSKYGPAPYDDTWAKKGEDTVFHLSGQTWYQVLWTPPVGGNAYYILANQYIGAKLNMLNAAASTPEVNAAIAWATTFFNTYTPSSKLSKTVRNTAVSYASLLEKYNNGYIGPGHCSE
jgi:hypothetical protein